MWDSNKPSDSWNGWRGSNSRNPLDREVSYGVEDIQHKAWLIVWADLAALQEIDLEQFERAGIENLVIWESWKVTYTYLGYPVEIMFAHWCVLDDTWLSEWEIHSKILEALWCRQIELPMRWNVWIHIPGEVAAWLWLEHRNYALRGEHFDTDNASETWSLLTVEDDLLLAQPRDIDSVLNWERWPKVNKIIVPNFYVKLYGLLKLRAWNK